MDTLSSLLAAYVDAKRAEALAEARRVEIGNLLAARLGAPREGSETHKLDGYAVKVTQPVNRKVDWEAFDLAVANGEGEHVPVKTKRELDLVGLRWVQENQPDFYRQLATAITATPGRVAIEVKEISK